MLRIRIKNFQSIEDASVEVDGFSVLVGRSNVGKSAIVRAVKAALTGAPANSYVRHGLECQRRVKGSKTCKCFCSVHLQTTGIDLLWEKGDSVNRYEYNGKDYSVVGRGYPEFLGEALSPLEVGSDKLLLQVFDQFNPLFLLDSSGSAAADTLSDVAGLDRINVAATQAEKDRKEANSVRKVRDGDLKKTRESLSLLAVVPSIEQLVSQANAAQIVVDDLAKKEINLSGYLQKKSLLEEKIQNLESASSVALLPLDFAGKPQALAQLEKWLPQFKDLVVTVKSLRGYDAVPLKALDINTDLIHRIENLAEHFQTLDLMIKKISLATQTPLEEFIVNDQAYRNLCAWCTQIQTLKNFFAQYKKIDSIQLKPLEQLSKDELDKISEWLVINRNLTAKITELETALETASEVEQRAKEELEAFDVCPTCQQPLPKADNDFLHISH